MKVTPLTEAWRQLKDEEPAALLLVRLGDFWEAFYEDAETLAKTANLTLTKRNGVPMCGFALHMQARMCETLAEARFMVRFATRHGTSWEIARGGYLEL